MRYHRRADDLIKIIQQPSSFQISHRLHLTTGCRHCCFEVYSDFDKSGIHQQFLAFLTGCVCHKQPSTPLRLFRHSMIIKKLVQRLLHHRLCKFRRHASKHQTVLHLSDRQPASRPASSKMVTYLLCIKKDAIHIKNDGSYHSLPSLKTDQIILYNQRLQSNPSVFPLF